MRYPFWYRPQYGNDPKGDTRVLADLVETDGISNQGAVIRATHEVVASRGQAVPNASTRARARYFGVLDRLGR